MNKKRFGLRLLAVLGASLIVFAQQSTSPPANSQAGRGQGSGRGGRSGRPPGRKVVLAWADTRNGIAQHDSVSHALAVIERLGYESGAYDTYIRTDSAIISAHPKMTNGQPASGGPSLSTVDAIFFLGHREIELDDSQKVDLLSFVKDAGKGFVAAHTATTAFLSWPEFGKMIGGRFDNHPWGTVEAPIVNEDPSFPATKHFPAMLDFRDEFYQTKEFSRDAARVVLRLDTSKLPANANFHRTDGDFPLAWAKMYGNGRVFYSALGHDAKTWDNPDVYHMYFEALKWALKITDADVTPRPLPAPATSSAK